MLTLVVIEKEKDREPCCELFYLQSAVGLFNEYAECGIQKLVFGLYINFTYNPPYLQYRCCFI